MVASTGSAAGGLRYGARDSRSASRATSSKSKAAAGAASAHKNSAATRHPLRLGGCFGIAARLSGPLPTLRPPAVFLIATDCNRALVLRLDRSRAVAAGLQARAQHALQRRPHEQIGRVV